MRGLEYERLAKEKLINHLIEKGYPKQSIKEEVLLDETGYIADIVVLKEGFDTQQYDSGNNMRSIYNRCIPVDYVLEVYEIKSKGRAERIESSKSKIDSILKDLSKHTLVFLVYVDETESLVFKEINKSTVHTFRSFYNGLEARLNVNENYVYFFRGHADTGYKIEPGIYRHIPSMRNITEEHILFKEGVRHCPSEFIDTMSAFEKLVKMQHYGFPTRLLDITTNPLVALYFACCSSNQTDGEVLIFRIRKDEIKYYDSDAVSIIANIAKRPYDFSSINFKGSLTEKYLLHEIRYEKPHFQDLINEKDIESVFCVYPKLDNPRIQKQAGAFFIYGVKGDNKTISPLISAPQRIIISSKGKKDILKELSVLGIDNSTLFPDIDNILKTIKEK